MRRGPPIFAEFLKEGTKKVREIVKREREREMTANKYHDLNCEIYKLKVRIPS